MKKFSLMFIVLIFVIAPLPAFGQEMVRLADGPHRVDGPILTESEFNLFGQSVDREEFENYISAARQRPTADADSDIELPAPPIASFSALGGGFDGYFRFGASGMASFVPYDGRVLIYD